MTALLASSLLLVASVPKRGLSGLSSLSCGDAAALGLLRSSSIDTSAALGAPARMPAACAASASAYSFAPSAGSYLRSEVVSSGIAFMHCSVEFK